MASIEGRSGASGRGSLALHDVSIRLGDRQVLDAVSFAVPPGRVVGLLGPNGAGKTTAMRIVFGVMTADQGSVRWEGGAVDAAVRSRWGYMPQERGLYVKMRVRDHLVYMARLRGMSKVGARARTDWLLASLGLADRAGEKIERLSGGLQQRLQLAVALVHAPDLLVLDEPFAGLDPLGIEHLSHLITCEAEAGRTVVFSSHQLDLVEDVCESIILMDRGRVILDGDLLTLKTASERRLLRVALDSEDPKWTAALDGVSVVHGDAGETLLALHPETDPLDVLDRARRIGRVRDFGLELPRLSQLFREAVRR